MTGEGFLDLAYRLSTHIGDQTGFRDLDQIADVVDVPSLQAVYGAKRQLRSVIGRIRIGSIVGSVLAWELSCSTDGEGNNAIFWKSSGGAF